MASFNISAQHSFVVRHGTNIRWYRALLCPCGSTPDAHRARATCIHCLGTGIRYDAPTILRGIVTGVEREKALIEAGILDPGDAMLGVSPLETHVISDWDMVELQWIHGQPFMGDVLTRRTGMTDFLSYPPKDIFSCTRIDRTTQNIIEYIPEADFQVSGRVLSWMNGRPQPAAGQNYSIKYTAVFQWIIFRPPSDRRADDVNLGQKVYLRKRANVGIPSFIETENPTVIFEDQTSLGDLYQLEFGTTISRIAIDLPGIPGWIIQSGWYLGVFNGIVAHTPIPIVGAVIKSDDVDLSVVNGVLIYNPPV